MWAPGSGRRLYTDIVVHPPDSYRQYLLESKDTIGVGDASRFTASDESAGEHAFTAEWVNSPSGAALSISVVVEAGRPFDAAHERGLLTGVAGDADSAYGAP
jgi:hypothetical protein